MTDRTFRRQLQKCGFTVRKCGGDYEVSFDGCLLLSVSPQRVAKIEKDAKAWVSYELREEYLPPLG